MSIVQPLGVAEEQIAEFCRRWRIVELSLFGSALRDDFRPDSDVDVLVAFASDSRRSLFDLVKMENELSDLFGRKVDLVDRCCLVNPFRRYEILRTRKVVYEA
jgi:predicted nucleotidyltransferase